MLTRSFRRFGVLKNLLTFEQIFDCMKRTFQVLLPALLLVAGCKPTPKTDKEKKSPAEPSISVALLDSTYSPADDFFEFVNAKWIAANPIPNTESKWGSFNILRDNSQKAVNAILEEAAKNTNAENGSNTQILGTFYRTGMDSARADKEGIQPLQPVLDEIQKLNDAASVSKYYATQVMAGVDIPFGVYVDQDIKQNTRYIPYIFQGGLGMPDRDYYLKDDASFNEVREKYKAHIQKVFELAGFKSEDAKTKAANVYDVELKLATAQMSKIEMRDPQKTYNKMTLADLEKNYPNFDWKTYFTTLGMENQNEFVIYSPAYLKSLNDLLKSGNATAWKDYYTFQAISSFAGMLGKDLENEDFQFYGVIVEGKKANDPRSKTISKLADNLLRDLIGQEYVKKHFDEKAKSRADELIKNVRAALGTRIDALTWMGAETKKKAHEKLDKIMVKIGYPEVWLTYTGLEVKDQHFVNNLMACNTYEFKRNFSKLGKPIDRKEWQMGPQTVNAYYNPTLNEIVFPAAILQPPFFDANADDAVNYGGIGMVIGHELTHGFDDQGRQFDADGNLTDWWTEEDANNFKKLTETFVKQYDAYEPIPSLHIQGELTLGENIADLGGMIIAYTAFQNTEQAKKGEKIDGLTPDQRLFINFAQIWRGHATEEYLRNQITTDPHSPQKYRVVGVLSNFEPFYKAFGVTESSKMYIRAADRANMW